MADRRGFRPLSRYLLHLMGSPLRTGYTARTSALTNGLTDAEIDALTVQEYDTFERTLSAVLGALRASAFVRGSWSLRAWRPKRGQPAVERTSYGSWEFARHGFSGWIDHPYRLVRKREDGSARELFVSEPYSLDAEGLRALVALADEGWLVSVGADWALHYPGSTLHITIEKRTAD
jgi:hypothetical protein